MRKRCNFSEYGKIEHRKKGKGELVVQSALKMHFGAFLFLLVPYKGTCSSTFRLHGHNPGPSHHLCWSGLLQWPLLWVSCLHSLPLQIHLATSGQRDLWRIQLGLSLSFWLQGPQRMKSQLPGPRDFVPAFLPITHYPLSLIEHGTCHCLRVLILAASSAPNALIPNFTWLTFFPPSVLA